MPTQNAWRKLQPGRLIALIGLVLALSAGPAAASHSPVQGGGTAGEGWELGPAADDFCTDNGSTVGVQFETTYYDISHTSADYIVKDHSGSVVADYKGPVSMRIDHGDMVSFPDFAEPGECADVTGAARPISLTDATVDGTSGTGSVDCDMTSVNGTYEREYDDIEIIFDVSCSVTGNQSGGTGTVSNVLIRHTVTGTQVPCFEVSGGCDNPDAGSKLDTSFVLSNP